MLGDSTPTTLAVVIITLVFSITLHEMMHGFAAFWLGDDTAQSHGRLSLNPLNHIDPLTTLVLPIITYALFKIPLLAAKPVPFNPYRVRFGEYGAALVGFAGPATNLVLAVLGGVAAHLFFGHVAYGVTQVFVIFTEINVAIFVFNMIPIPPLDGSRIFYAVAPESVQEVMAQFERVGIFIVFGLVLLVPAFTNVLANLNQTFLRILL